MANISFHDALKNSYAKKKADKLGGYILDKSLSNDNQQTYYNPTSKKLLYSITGTHSAGDWITDAKLATGIGFKESKRYKDAHDGLRQAKEKYGVQTAHVVGHSLGGTIAGYIASQGDKVLTLDKGATIGQRVKKGETAYRTSGDLVSALNATSKHTKTLSNPNGGSLISTIGKGVAAIATGNIAPALSAVGDVLSSHNVKNIENEAIFV